ncbi:ROK family protein [bacterium]|nr:MAG: ROK family protein [bacterium]
MDMKKFIQRLLNKLKNKTMTLSIDIGGSKIASGIVQLGDTPKVSDFQKTETPKNKEQFLNTLKNIITEYQKSNEINKICIGCAGLINKTGKIVYSPNLQFLNDFDLRKYIKNEFDINATVANDVQCFTLAEAKYGAGKNFNTVIGITIGTGIGGGIVIDKKSFTGSQGFAGEFGHIVVDLSHDKQCPCGNYGCLEQFVSCKAIENNYLEITGKNKTAREIELMSQKGDLNSIEAINKMAKYLEIGIINIISFLNPDVIVIGGGIIINEQCTINNDQLTMNDKQTNTLFEDAKKYALENLITGEVKVEIKLSELEYDAVLIGATLAQN